MLKRELMRRSTARRFALLLMPSLILLAACNLALSIETTPTPIRITQIVPVTATPGGIGLATPVPGAIVIGATPLPGTAAAANSGAPPPATSNVIEWLINFVVIPAWNFIYTFALQSVGSLWSFAGARGGVVAQVLCCIAPAIVLVGLVIRRFVWPRFID